MVSQHPLFRRFESELKLSFDLTIEWSRRASDFFFRPQGADTRFLWCELDRRHVADEMSDALRIERLKKRLLKNILQRRVWRYWPLSEDEEFVVIPEFALFRRQGASFWLRLNWLQAPPRPRFLEEIDLSGVETALEPFAQLWSLAQAMGRTGEAQWSWLQCVRGDAEELRRSLSSYMKLSGHYLNSYGRGDLRFGSVLCVPHDAPDPEKQWSTRQQVADLLDQHFVLRFHPLGKRIYLRDGKPAKRPDVHIRYPRSLSPHERLEALLLWRDFLQGKLPPDEVEALLSSL